MKNFVLGWLAMVGIAVFIGALLQFGFNTVAVIVAVGVLVFWILMSLSGGGDRGSNNNQNNI